MRYLSLCSGIEAATAAWHPLGWQAEAYSEIEKFPSAVLAHHYPDTPNWGDMTQYKDWPHAAIDVLVGGTPCQSFSVAGLRKGLADPRGNLMLTYLAIAAKYQPQWLVWENVPGVLSSNGGRDFGTFLGGLAELGYGFAYRVLDAQYFGLAQRRRRVFVVACAGDWARAAAVLFERHSLQGHPAPSREAGASVAALTANGVGTCGADDNQAQAGHLIAMAHGQGGAEINTNGINPAPTCNHEAPILCVHGTQDPCTSDIAFALGRNCGQENAVAIRAANTSANGHGVSQQLAHTLDGTNGQAAAFAQNQRDELRELEVAGALAAQPGTKQQIYIAQGITIHGSSKTRKAASYTELAGSLRTKPPGSIENSSTTAVQDGSVIRRLTPKECERLQGFPDDYTQIAWRNKPIENCPDGPRYKALGNSMAVPVMRWIGERIAAVNDITPDANKGLNP